MGVDTYLKTPIKSDEAALERDLEMQGLDENLRYCKMTAWKSTFEECTGHHVLDLEWSTVPANVVAEWADAVCLKPQPLNEDETKMFNYLLICKKYSASIVFA